MAMFIKDAFVGLDELVKSMPACEGLAQSRSLPRELACEFDGALHNRELMMTGQGQNDKKALCVTSTWRKMGGGGGGWERGGGNAI